MALRALVFDVLSALVLTCHEPLSNISTSVCSLLPLK